MKTHLIMPMAGAGSRFNINGYTLPKPLIEIEGMPFFYWATKSLTKFADFADITYVVLQDHVERFGLDRLIYKYFPEARLTVIPKVTQGPMFTCLEGLKNINDEAPVIFNDCDHMFKCSSLNDLINTGKADIDGALLTFESEMPQFSYVKYDKSKKIIGTVEKKAVSNHAICGAYYYKSANLFEKIANLYMNNCPYKETFLSGMYNIMCEQGYNVKDYVLDFHVEFGTPEEYAKAKGSKLFNELI
jgi:NDP-sugar pyrophosphorylase family protein